MTEKAYRWLTQIVLEQSESMRSAPVLLGLEGGYDSRALASSVKEVLGVLTYEGRRERLPKIKTKRGRDVVEKVFSIHSKFGVWIS